MDDVEANRRLAAAICALAISCSEVSDCTCTVTYMIQMNEMSNSVNSHDGVERGRKKI